MEVVQVTRLGLDLLGHLDDGVVSAEAVQQRVVCCSCVTISNEKHSFFHLETTAVIAEPEAVVLEGAARRDKGVQPRGGPCLAHRESDWRVED